MDSDTELRVVRAIECVGEGLGRIASALWFLAIIGMGSLLGVMIGTAFHR